MCENNKSDPAQHGSGALRKIVVPKMRRRCVASARAERGAVVINITSDAAVTPYSGWGAYGASKAALRHLTAIWSEEARAEGISFLSIDPGDMDTPLHALAVPDADPTTLKRPDDAAVEIIGSLVAALPSQAIRQTLERA